MRKKILPYNCPFCDGPSETVRCKEGYFIRCSSKNCIGSTCKMPKRKLSDAIAEWNCRYVEW